MSCESAEIKHLHLIRFEDVSPSEDCVPVLYSTWYWVGVAKVCVWTSVTVGFIADVDVGPSTKYRTKTWTHVNREYWAFHHALEWCQSFFIDERKYERIGSGTIATTGR